MSAEDMLFAGIDVGSTAVRVAVGQRLAAGNKEQTHVIGAIEVPSEGINRGMINSIEDAVSSVSSALEKVERMVGAQIGSAWVSISGANVVSTNSRGVVAVSRPDGEIREEDVERAVEAAQTVATPVNYEIIHVIPRTFAVDGQPGIKDPVGMNGIRLEVEAQIIQGPSALIKNLTKCIYRTGIGIEHLVLGVLASAEAVATPRQKELGVAVVNIGRSASNVVVFEQGDIIHLASLPIGSEHVTSDIAIGLRTSIDTAEKVKLRHASALPESLMKKDEINLRELGEQDEEIVSKKYVAEIVQARLEELLEKIDKELNKIGRSGLLPAGVILTGGGAKLDGIVDLAKRKLRLPAFAGATVGVTSITDRINDPSFTTAVGLVLWGINETPEAGRRFRVFGKYRPVDKVATRIKKLFGVFAP